MYRFACGAEGGNRRLLLRYIEVSFDSAVVLVCPGFHCMEELLRGCRTTEEYVRFATAPSRADGFACALFDRWQRCCWCPSAHTRASTSGATC